MRNTCYSNSMCFLHTFLIPLIKKYVFLTCLNDTCPFYIWVVENLICKKFVSFALCLIGHLNDVFAKKKKKKNQPLFRYDPE
jgi:hypothetical protein